MKLLAFLTLLSVATNSSVEWDGLKVKRSEKEWLKKLGPDRFKTMRKKGIDSAFIGIYAYPRKDEGIYICAGCELSLFLSIDQYDAGGGFPCFKKTIYEKNVYYEEDLSIPLKRYEVVCRKCDAHLGHLFHDGPEPKYFRYCINSTALIFKNKQITN